MATKTTRPATASPRPRAAAPPAADRLTTTPPRPTAGAAPAHPSAPTPPPALRPVRQPLPATLADVNPEMHAWAMYHQALDLLRDVAAICPKPTPDESSTIAAELERIRSYGTARELSPDELSTITEALHLVGALAKQNNRDPFRFLNANLGDGYRLIELMREMVGKVSHFLAGIHGAGTIDADVMDQACRHLARDLARCAYELHDMENADSGGTPLHAAAMLAMISSIGYPLPEDSRISPATHDAYENMHELVSEIFTRMPQYFPRRLVFTQSYDAKLRQRDAQEAADRAALNAQAG